MSQQDTHVVTGAFGYSGRYIARRLLDRGCAVRTLTNSTARPHDFGDRIKVHPFHFGEPEKMRRSLAGASVLYNTYWVRFNHKGLSHAQAVRNTILMFEAAKTAGVERIVHVSITNPSEDSPLEYFRGKAVRERHLRGLGVSYAILRPAVLFGKEDILINNIAWLLRRFPVFGVFGDGRYRVQLIYVDDLAQLAVEQGLSRENVVTNAIGPETFTYRRLVTTIGEIIGKPRRIISVSPGCGCALSRVIGMLLGDVVLTREEIGELIRAIASKFPGRGPGRGSL
ncbi:MAG: SDR family oxidoreductase, partial [Phycisphaerae bacterium]